MSYDRKNRKKNIKKTNYILTNNKKMAQLYNITLYLSYKSVRYDFREKKKKHKIKFQWKLNELSLSRHFSILLHYCKLKKCFERSENWKKEINWYVKENKKREKKVTRRTKNRRIFYEKRHLSEIHISFFFMAVGKLSEINIPKQWHSLAKRNYYKIWHINQLMLST